MLICLCVFPKIKTIPNQNLNYGVYFETPMSCFKRNQNFLCRPTMMDHFFKEKFSFLCSPPPSLFFIGRKILKCFNDFYKCHFSISLQKHNQVRWNKITREMCKCDYIFPYLQSSTLFKWLFKLFLTKFYLKNGW